MTSHSTLPCVENVSRPLWDFTRYRTAVSAVARVLKAIEQGASVCSGSSERLHMKAFFTQNVIEREIDDEMQLQNGLARSCISERARHSSAVISQISAG